MSTAEIIRILEKAIKTVELSIPTKMLLIYSKEKLEKYLNKHGEL